jgi:hypothetical protein
VDPDPTLQCNADPCNTAFLSIFWDDKVGCGTVQ